MKVKVGNSIYDAVDQPVMVILSDEDKENIRNMAPEATKYYAYPDTMSDEAAEAWISSDVKTEGICPKFKIHYGPSNNCAAIFMDGVQLYRVLDLKYEISGETPVPYLTLKFYAKDIEFVRQQKEAAVVEHVGGNFELER